MRLLLSAMLMIFPVLSIALSPESEEFVGISGDGKKLTKLLSSTGDNDSLDWTGKNWIYGSSQDKRLRYCWINSTTDPANLYGHRPFTHFVCAPQHGAKPNVFYKRGHYNYNELTGKKIGDRYREAMANFEKIRKTGYQIDRAYLFEYYICDKGCDGSMPIFIFEVSFEE